MPIYEYHCKKCAQNIEILIRGVEVPVCPFCGSQKLDKQLSVPAVPANHAANLPTYNGPAPTCGRPQCGSGCMFE